MRFTAILCFCVNAIVVNAQDYFQQKVEYTIHVSLDDKNHVLRGNETFVYTNNSPHTLEFIYIHLWPNAYSNPYTELGKQALEEGNLNLYFSEKDDKGFIDSLNFSSDGKKLNWELDKQYKDIAKITLNAPLKSFESIEISTPFRIKIPNANISRLGHVGESYQITQWYPKPAVYDNDGWHPMPYLNQGEFYSEFGSFDVFITLPENYVVGATGDLVDGENEKNWLEEIHQKTLKKLSDSFERKLDFPASSNNKKTLHYYQEKVHDFAWFADKRFNILKSSIELPHSKRNVDTWLMFTDAEAHLWKDAIPYINDAVYYYSLWLGDYPYNHATAVDGTISAGAGMEYPNITIIGTSGSPKALETVIVHEVGHNWFYGILGNNERQHAWMDEGLNSFYEDRYFETKHPDRKFINLPLGLQKFFGLDIYSQRYMHDLTYLVSASYNSDQPIFLHSKNYSSFNYGGIVYGKSAIMFDYLRAYLGDEEFDRIMKVYYETWKFKHPQPQDLQDIFTKNSGKDLAWFFNDILRSTKKIDYKIVSRKKENNFYTVNVKSNTKINAPISIFAIKNDSVIAETWTIGKHRDNATFTLNEKPDYFKINHDLRIPEINNHNNYLRNGGLFKKVEPIRFQFLGGIDNPNRTTINYFPIMGWNNYDKFMAGLALYNRTIYSRTFEYVLMPMYAFGTKDLSGLGNVKLNLKPEKTFQVISLGAKAKRFTAYRENNELMSYNKLSPYAEFVLKPTQPRKKIKTSFLLGYDFIQNKFIEEEIGRFFENIQQYSAAIKISSRQVLKPKSVELKYNLGSIENTNVSTFSDISLTANYRYNYTKDLDGISVRMFAGNYFKSASDSRFRYYVGGQNGISDYTYESLYFGRTEPYYNFLSQQMIETHGAMRTLMPSFFSSNEWLLAFNFDFELPSTIKIPFNFYADIAFMPVYTFNVNSSTLSKVNEAYFAAGLSLNLFNDVVNIYFPLILSNDIKDIYEFNEIQFLQRIRINIRFNQLNPFKIIEQTIF